MQLSDAACDNRGSAQDPRSERGRVHDRSWVFEFRLYCQSQGARTHLTTLLPIRFMPSDIPAEIQLLIGVPLASGVSLWAALLLLRCVSPRACWVVALSTMLPASLVMWWMVRSRHLGDFLLWLWPESWRLPILAAALMIAAAVALRRYRGWPLRESLWLAFSGWLIFTATVPERYLAPEFYANGLGTCIDGVDRFLPVWGELASDFIPNMVLYMPLGYVLALRSGGHFRPGVPTALTCALAVEVYQALFTSRVCAPRDVIANLTGVALATLLVRLGRRLAGGSRSSVMLRDASASPR